MKDISVSASKVRGRPKGRPSKGGKWSDQIVYPEMMPFSDNHMRKLSLWKTGLIVKGKSV